jgi:hypothetical protein
MTPKEKSTELIGKFSPLVTTWDCYNDCPANPDEVKEDAKKCAIVCVNEIMNIQLDCGDEESTYEYWQQVLTEINKP